MPAMIFSFSYSSCKTAHIIMSFLILPIPVTVYLVFIIVNFTLCLKKKKTTPLSMLRVVLWLLSLFATFGRSTSLPLSTSNQRCGLSKIRALIESTGGGGGTTNFTSAPSATRFWVEEYAYTQGSIITKTLLEKVDTGLIILQGQTVIPIQNKVLQIQHATTIKNLKENDTAIVCAFAPRASHVFVSPNEEERPVNLSRRSALDESLLKLTSITSDELLSERMAGTSASRIYRSFVSPRPKAVHMLEPLERAANRTAVQIELSLRQLRADDAVDYLRNTDRSEDADILRITNNTGDLQFRQRTVHPVILVLDNIRSAFNVDDINRRVLAKNKAFTTL